MFASVHLFDQRHCPTCRRETLTVQAQGRVGNLAQLASSHATHDADLAEAAAMLIERYTDMRISLYPAIGATLARLDGPVALFVTDHQQADRQCIGTKSIPLVIGGPPVHTR